MKVFNKIKAFMDEKELNVISVIVVVLFVVTLIALFIGFSSSLLNKNGSQLYIDSDGVRYLKIDKEKYLRQKLVIQTGDKLPSISDYFLDMAKIDEDDFSINYYNNGDNSVPLTNFTYEVNGVKHIKGHGPVIVVLTSGDDKYEIVLWVEDEIKPNVILKPVIVDEGSPINIYDFIALYSDNSLSSNYTIKYKNKMEYTDPGIYSVGLVVCDPSNNCFEGNGELTIISKKTGSSSATTVKKKSTNKTTPSHNNSNGSSKKKSSSSSSSKKTQTSGGSGSSSSLKDRVSVTTIKPGRTSTITHKTGCTPSGTPGGVVIHRDYVDDVTLKTINHFGTVELIKGGVETIDYENDAVECKIIEEKARYWNFSKFNGSTSELYTQALGNIEGNRAVSNTMVSLINKYRKDNGRSTLANAEILNAIAATRALEILYYGNHEKGISSHIRPNGYNLSDLFLGVYPLYHDGKVTQSSSIAENIYVDFVSGSTAAKTPYNAWISSSGHKANILDKDFKYHGLAKVDYTDSTGNKIIIWVQILSKFK